MARMRGGSVAPRPARRARSFACGPTDGTDRSPTPDRERSDNRLPHPSAGTLPPGCRRTPASLRPSVHRPPIDRCTKHPSAVLRRSRRTSIDRPPAAARNVPRPSFGGRAARPAAASRSPASPSQPPTKRCPSRCPIHPPARPTAHTPYGKACRMHVGSRLPHARATTTHRPHTKGRRPATHDTSLVRSARHRRSASAARQRPAPNGAFPIDVAPTQPRPAAPSRISRFISATALRIPTKTALDTIAWPMCSSRAPGRAAIGWTFT